MPCKTDLWREKGTKIASNRQVQASVKQKMKQVVLCRCALGWPGQYPYTDSSPPVSSLPDNSHIEKKNEQDT